MISRGCGLSDRDTDKLSFENWVNDLARVVDAAGFDRFPILATCWGGPVAVEYAARYPKRVSHLVLYGTYARGRLQVGEPEVTRKARLMLELTRLGWGKENDAFMQVWSSTFQPGGTLDYLRSWAEQMRLATTAENAVRLLEIGWSADVREAARKLTVPRSCDPCRARLRRSDRGRPPSCEPYPGLPLPSVRQPKSHAAAR